MRYKIVKIQKLMWRNIMSSTKCQKIFILHYSIDTLNPSSFRGGPHIKEVDKFITLDTPSPLA